MSRRSTRSSVKQTKPNASLYVGYVEDDETPEMIMRKFQQMEAMKAALRPAKKEKSIEDKKGKSDKAEMSDSDEENKDVNCGALNEDQLNELFNQTSFYSINALKRNNEICFTKQTVDEDGFVVGMEDPEYENLMFEVDYDVAGSEMMNWTKPDENDYIGEDAFWGDDDNDDGDTRKRGKRTRKAGSQSGRQRRSGFQAGGIGSTSLRVAADGKTKLKLLCREAFYMKIPNYPIPRSWGIVLQPFLEYPKDISQIKGYSYMERDLLTMTNVKDYYVNPSKPMAYKAILMDPPFDLSDSPIAMDDEKDKGFVTMEDFAKLPIGQLIPESGMMFIWVPSELTIQINHICLNWGYYLVEHATWALRNLKWQIENSPSNLLRISKVNLLLFRRFKGNGKAFGRLELRHQRTSDSYFDYVRMHPETGRELKSDYHYKMIETLLPCLDDQLGDALFLWAPKNEKRPGWQMVCDTRYLEKLKESEPDMDIGDW